MTKSDFKEKLLSLLKMDIGGISAYDKISIAKKVLFEFLKMQVTLRT